MIKRYWGAAVAAFLCFVATSGWCSTHDEARSEEERLLGRADQDAQQQAYLPFKRRHNVSGMVEGSFAASAEAAGVPAVVRLEIGRAFASAADGDSFSVSYEQEYTVEGTSIGVPKVMWAELHTSAGETRSVHRFRASRSGRDELWLANGERAGATAVRLPVDDINISSGFGLRSDPIQQQAQRGKATGGPARAKAKGKWRLVMHHGVDFAAETGTPVYAAAAGTVTGARPNGGYGNWIEIEHGDDLATVYGHLSAYAPGIDEGMWVEQGQLIGFVGSTGRSTGPHLHFELQKDGVPANPIIHPAIKPPQLRGGDLERFRRVVARNLEEARREAETE